MYLDKNYKLPENLPQDLINDIEEMESHFPDNMWQFDRDLEVVEAVTKNCALEGRITDEELDRIFKRYGLR